MKYLCIPCGYIYDEQLEERLWKDLAENWVCSDCGGAKENFAEFKIEQA